MKIRKREYGKPAGRVLAIFLSLCLAATSVTLPAWAEDGGAGNEAAEGAGDTAAVSEAADSQDGEYIEDEYIVWYDDFFEENSGKRTRNSAAAVGESDAAALLEEDEVAAVQEGGADGSDSGIALIKLDSGLSEEEEADFIDELASRPKIAGVEKNRTVYAFGEFESADAGVSASGVTEDAYSDQQYAVSSVRADEAWDMIDYDAAAKVTVAVVDSGVDAQHPDLTGKILDGYNCMEYDSGGRRYNSNDASDDNGHGTHVAGIIAAVSGNGTGISGVTGTLDVQILPVKVLNDEGEGSVYEVVNGIKYAADNGADIINLSLGSSYPSSLEEAAVEYAQSKGVLCVAAAGNDATNVAYSYPACYDGVLAVGSIDQQDERSYFSNYGDRLDVSAPGSSILSTVPEDVVPQLRAEGRTIYGSSLEGYYAVLSGTSMASPYAAGVAAIYKAVNPSADSSDIRDHLKSTARDVGDIGFDIYTGSGCVDAAAALGEPIRQIAVRFKSPQAGSELYEKVNVRFQVNTGMDIDHVSLYMNEVSDSSKIADIRVNAGENFYEYALDTKNYSDGNYTLIAKAFDSSGNAVESEASVGSLTIANTISDGFVIEVEDPEGDPANLAEVEIYGLSQRTGEYDYIYSGTTSDLGYARVKNLDPYNAYSAYYMRIFGSYGESGHTSYYSYWLPEITIGEKVHADAETAGAEKVSFSMQGADGKALDSPYLLLTPVAGKTEDSQGTELNDSPVWTMYADSSLWLSQGNYHFETYWSPSTSQQPDYSQPGYYLAGETTVTGDGGAVTADYREAGILRGEFEEGFDGFLEVSAAGTGERIPFLPGEYIRGKVLYLTPGAYEVKAVVSKEIDGENWSVTLEKDETYTIEKGRTQTAFFSAQVKLSKFEPGQNTLRTDEDGTLYMYRGETLRTVNEMSLNGDSVVSGFSGDYPTFRVYRLLEDGSEELAYQVTDTWQARSSYWNSSRLSVTTGKIPEAGAYRAELTFDAGPLGGYSELSFEFELRNQSGGAETDSVLRLGNSSSLPYAEMALYRWNDETQSWENALKDGGSIRYGADSTAAIEDSMVQFSEEGINVAVIQYTHRKEDSYASPQSYYGFQTYTYDSLEDLKNITLSDTVSEVNVRVSDRYGRNLTGTNIRADVLFSLRSSADGRLVNEEPLPDVKLPDGTVHIPDDSYDYVSSSFTAYGEEYFLIETDVSTGSGTISLDGTKTSKLDIVLPDSLSGATIWPVLSDGKNLSGSGLNFTGQSSFYWSTECYTPMMTLQTEDRQGQITVMAPEIDLSSAQTITVAGDFKAEIALNQTQISGNQNLTGEIRVLDSAGNRMISSAKRNGAVYEEQAPVLITGLSGTQGAEAGTVSYTELRLTPEDYGEEGEYFLRFSCPFGQDTLVSEDVAYRVGSGSAAAGVTIQDSAFFETGEEGGIAYAVAAAGSDGYRTLTASIPSSQQEQYLEFRQIRDGRIIASTGIRDVFGGSQNDHTAGFQVKAGDRIEVQVSAPAE